MFITHYYPLLRSFASSALMHEGYKHLAPHGVEMTRPAMASLYTISHLTA